MCEKILLVLQTPNRGGGDGYQYLIAQMNADHFDEKVWSGGKTDQLIHVLGKIRQVGTQFGSRDETQKHVLDLIDKKMPREIVQVRLPFALPSKSEIRCAVKRLKRAEWSNELAKLENKAQATIKGIASLKTNLKRDIKYAAETPSPAIKLHLERVCIADRSRDLAYYQGEHKKMQQKIRTLQKQLAQI